MINSHHQLELLLSGEVCTLYQSLVGHDPDLVACHFLTPNELAMIFDNAFTPVERLLFDKGFQNLAKEVRDQIDQVFHNELVKAVEKYTKRPIVDILTQSKMETGRKSVVLVFGSE